MFVMRKGLRIKIIGDSLASGMGTSGSKITDSVICTTGGNTFFQRSGGHGWAQLLDKDFPKLTVVNNGCDGITSTEALQCLNQLYQVDDALVLVLLGANDRKESDGMKRLEANLRWIVGYCLERGSRVILLTPHPSTPENEALPNRLYRMKDVAEVINKVGDDTGCIVIDLYNRITEAGIDIGAVMHGGDGNHPTDEMARIEYEIIIETLNEVLKADCYE